MMLYAIRNHLERSILILPVYSTLRICKACINFMALSTSDVTRSFRQDGCIPGVAIFNCTFLNGKIYNYIKLYRQTFPVHFVINLPWSIGWLDSDKREKPLTEPMMA